MLSTDLDEFLHQLPSAGRQILQAGERGLTRRIHILDGIS
jgi:hypothetical protein